MLPQSMAIPPVSLYGSSMGLMAPSFLMTAALDVFSYGLACNGQKRSVYQSFGSQLSHYGRYAAGVVQIVHVGISSRSQMTEVRSHSR